RNEPVRLHHVGIGRHIFGEHPGQVISWSAVTGHDRHIREGGELADRPMQQRLTVHVDQMFRNTRVVLPPVHSPGSEDQSPHPTLRLISEDEIPSVYGT